MLQRVLAIPIMAIAFFFDATAQPLPLIVDFEAKEHISEITKIATQDAEKLFIGGDLVIAGMIPHEMFLEQNTAALKTVLLDVQRTKTRVLMVNGQVAGFVTFTKMKEPTKESIKKDLKAANLSEQDIQLNMQTMVSKGNLKEDDASSETWARIEALAVDRAHRGQQYGKLLLQDAMDQIARCYPEATYACLLVNNSNDIATALYKSQGFTRARLELALYSVYQATPYEKSIAKSKL